MRHRRSRRTSPRLEGGMLLGELIGRDFVNFWIKYNFTLIFVCINCKILMIALVVHQMLTVFNQFFLLHLGVFLNGNSN